MQNATQGFRSPRELTREGKNGAPGEEPSESRSLRVLVIDDEPLIGTTLRILLDAHDVHVVTSGRKAQEVLSTSAEFDVILCDLMLDDVSGMDLSRWLEREKPQISERLVFMTGGAFTDDARTFLRNVPTDRQLEKPFSSEEIHRALGLFERRG